MKKRNILRRIITAVISIALILGTIVIPAKTAEAAVWYSGDPFNDIGRSKKGAQNETENCSNIFINAFMETGFQPDDKSDTSGYHEFLFEGDTYYFRVPSGLESYSNIVKLNNQNLTVTVQLMLRYDPKRLRLIEPSARNYSNFLYYAPNMTEPAVVKEYRAFMAFLAETFSLPECHVDAWVCGNEVNAAFHWNFFGTDCMQPNGGKWKVSNPNLLMEKYGTFYDIVYDAMKAKNKKTRVCICVDHCWTETEKGNIISTKTFLNMFAAREGNEKDWCIAFHAYPADLEKPNIWSSWNGHAWNQKNENAQFIDGYNLEILTGYVKNHFGSNHRIMLTEQGFSDKMGEDIQAACLVYTFYKARFDDMIDVFHVLKFRGIGGGYEFNDKAAKIWEKLDNGSDADEQWILSQVGGTLGISSFSQITPNWKSQGTIQAELKNFRDENPCYYQGVDYSRVFDYEYFMSENPILEYYWGRELTFDEAFGYFATYSMDRDDDHLMKSHPNFDLLKYKADHPELVAQFGDNNRAYYTYYCVNFSADPEQVKAFVARFYTLILGREPDEEGINYYTQILINKQQTASEVAYGFVNSPEFTVEHPVKKREFVKRMYAAFFNREGGTDGEDWWLGYLNRGYTRNYVLAGFTNSNEFKNLCDQYGIVQGSLPMDESMRSNSISVDASNVDPAKLDEYIDRLYLLVLNRDPEEEGKNYWREEIIEGETYNASTAAEIGFFNSPEYLGLNKSDDEFIRDCYLVFLNREPEEDGFEYWKEKFRTGEYDRQKLIEVGVGHSNEFKDILTSYGFRIIE